MPRKSILVALTLALSLLFTSTAYAAPTRDSGPSGTIDLAATSGSDPSIVAFGAVGPRYGDTVWFATSVNGKTAKGSMVYVSVVCNQDGTIVYQWSAAPDFGFPLVDQAGQGLEWDGTDASCRASLIYLVEKGRTVELTVLDQTIFAANGSAAG